MNHPLLATAALLLTLTTTPLLANDWPQWRGPSRDDLSKETGLLKQWPEGGPKKIWSYDKAGSGYSGFAIVDGKLFTMGTRDTETPTAAPASTANPAEPAAAPPDPKKNPAPSPTANEILICLDATTGQELWTTKLGSVLGNNWGNGPRGTPCVDGDTVYTMGGEGTLVAASTKDGKELWRVTMESLGGKRPGWGYTESVCVDGKLVLCTPGGPKGTVAALDKKTGQVVWQSKDWTDGAHYSSIIPAKINGQDQYVQRTDKNIAGLDAKTGAVLWKQPYPGKTAVIPTPIVQGNQIYVTAGYGVGCMSFTIEPGNQIKMLYDETASPGKVMKNHHGGVILLNDHVYGYSDGNGLVCQDFKTGQEVWAEKKAIQKGAISYADGNFYFLEEGPGNVVLLEASPSAYVEKSRFKLDPQTTIRSPSGHIWTHPVISNGRLYLRDQDLIFCYAIK